MKRRRRPRGRRVHIWRRASLWTLAMAGVGFLGYTGLRHLPLAAAVQVAEAPKTAVTAPVEKVHISLQTLPPVKAEVKWGKKKLGFINIKPRKPFILDRPRDSGPVDLVIRADGFLPVNTRANTFNDSKMLVKLTALTEKHTLLGFRQELTPDGGAPEGADAGAPAGGPLMPAPGAIGVPPATP